MTNGKMNMAEMQAAAGLSTRKNVAQLLGVSADQVRRNEKRWGLDAARADLNSRCVRYRTFRMLLILRGRGFVE